MNHSEKTLDAFSVKGRTEIERYILEEDLKGYGDHLDMVREREA